MAKQAVAADTGLEPIDRLEEKVKLLVSIVTELRNEQGQMADARLASSEMAGSELSTLRDERDLIRSRVVDMLTQLESI